jgi:peptidoglycan/xylan/chitin deacetylase (PgdA/CDA1 family)
MIFRAPFFLPWIYPNLIWRLPAEEKAIYLTFDDGPVPGPTEFVLDALSMHKLKATFFCIGDNLQKHPRLLLRILDEGHAIGNHTFNHLNGWKTSTLAYVQNAAKFDLQLERIKPGLKTQLFRPPYGRITRKQISRMSQYEIIMWDVLTHDYHRGVSPEKCLRQSLRAVRSGSIVVFHDSLKAEKNLLFTLPRFIESCLSQGYTFKRLI